MIFGNKAQIHGLKLNEAKNICKKKGNSFLDNYILYLRSFDKFFEHGEKT